jgi:adenylate kinase
MLRRAIASGSDLGRRVKAVYDRGDLVSDELMIELIRERLQEDDTAGGFVLDGFPRTLAQAEALDGLLDELGRELSVVFSFEIPDEVAVARLVERARNEHRTDDTPDVIAHRIAVYKEQTEPLVAHYRSRGILVGIPADRSRDEVFAELQRVLDQVGVR